MHRVLRFVPCVVAASVLAFVTVAVAAADPPGIKWVAAPHVSSVFGDDVYEAYCAVCHGPTGRGNGPAVKFLATPVPDLSRICERDEDFSATHVEFHVAGDTGPHRTMADWKEIFHNNYPTQSFANLALHNVVKHVERLQVSHDPR